VTYEADLSMVLAILLSLSPFFIGTSCYSKVFFQGWTLHHAMLILINIWILKLTTTAGLLKSSQFSLEALDQVIQIRSFGE
jgi:hypothetical protein